MEQSWWKSLLQASRLERAGMLAFAVIIVLLIVIRYWIQQTAKPPLLTREQRQLQLAVQDFLNRQPKQTEFAMSQPANPATGTLFPFDPNTLDSGGFIKLGLRPFTVQKLLNWRRKGKVFYDKISFSKVWTLTPEEYNRLAPYIVIQVAKPDHQQQYENRFRQEPLPAVIDLNTTDSATLVRLNGIGPTLAGKIVGRRRALGGFLRHEQLLEVYRFPDSTFSMLREKLAIRPEAIHRINLNTATEEDLMKHPYIGERMARNIILYREGLRRFDNIQQLRQVPLMNEEIYRKLAPYFSVP